MGNKKLIKFIIPIIIIIAIAIIWFVKNGILIKTQKLSENKDKNEIATEGTNKEFQLEATSIDLEKLKSYKMPIIIDFGADSCIPCKQMAPVLKKLNSEMQGKVIIKFVDVWKNGDAAAEFPIQIIPTQIFYTHDGKPYVPSKELGIEFLMYNIKESNEHAFTVHQGGLTEEQMRIILKDMGVK